jgi:DNA-binding response OmpR family regulator
VTAPKILIVEDELIVAEDIRAKLVQKGYRVIGIADSCDKALDLAKANPPDLMILDIRIRGENNGVETALIIQSHLSETIPLIFLTAFPEADFPVLKALDSYLFINKPFSDDILYAAVEKVLKTQRGLPS